MATFKVVSPNGKYKDRHTYNDVLDYILNPIKTPHGYILGRSVTSPENAASEMATLSSAHYKNNGTRVRHMILAFSPQESVTLADVFDIASALADYYASEYQIVAAVHEKEDFPHIHLVMNTVNFKTGKKYTGRKLDYYQFIERARNILQCYGLSMRTEADEKI